MEEHEGDLKKRLKEMEEQHEWKSSQFERKVELMEREIAQYIQQEEEMTSRIMEMEKQEDEQMEKVGKLELQLEESENAREDSEQESLRLSEEVQGLQKEIGDLQENMESVNEELEQMRIENNDLNERLIELDSYEQECEEKVKEVESKASLLEDANLKLVDRVTELENVENKASLLEDANLKLMDRITELESVEIDLRSKLANSSVSVKSELMSSSGLEKSTDTDDLNVPTGRKLTGMFERLQDLESENQNYFDQLSNLQGADVLNKKLNEKVKLLEDSEEKLMERVMELEDREDFLTKENQKIRNSVTPTDIPDILTEVSDLRETVELLKTNLEILRSENEEYQEKIGEAEKTIQSLQGELSVQKTEMEMSDAKVTELQTSMKDLEDSLLKEKQCVQILQDSEKNLSVKLDQERSCSQTLETELSEITNKLKIMEKEHETRISELNETVASQQNTVSDLEISLSHFQHNEKEHAKRLSELTEENNALIKLVKSKKVHVNSNLESDSENTILNQMNSDQNTTPISAQSTPIKSELDPCAKAELISDISNITVSPADKRCANCIALNQRLSEQSKRGSTLQETVSALEKEMKEKEKTWKTLCSKCHDTLSDVFPSVLSETDSFFGLNKTEEFAKKMQTQQERCEELNLQVREKKLNCRVKELEDELEEFRRVLQDIVLDIQIRFHDEIQEVIDEVPCTFELPADLPVSYSVVC
jgi:chromosome segregation ATPase